MWTTAPLKSIDFIRVTSVQVHFTACIYYQNNDFSPCLSFLSSKFVSLILFFCAVGSFSEHLDQINGRNESVDSTDNLSKPPTDQASHMARQRLETTEKKKISGKVTKSLSASALSLMIPGGKNYEYYGLFFIHCNFSTIVLAPK